MKKKSLNFMNRLELAIFKNSPEGYVPISSTIMLSTIIAAIVSIVIIFFLQMFNADKSAGEITLVVAFSLAFLFCGYIFNKSARVLPSTPSKLYLAIYALLLFGLSSLLFIWIMVWVVIIAVALFVIWIIIKSSSSNSGNKKRIRVHYKDGSSEEMVENGKGVLGETFYKGESGHTHVE